MAAVSVIQSALKAPPPFVVWVADESCPTEFDALFFNTKSFPFRIVGLHAYAEALVDGQLSSRIHNLVSPWLLWDRFADKEQLSWGGFYQSYAKVVQAMFENAAPAVGERLALLRANLNGRAAVGVHLRRGDFVAHYSISQKKEIATPAEVAEFCLDLDGVEAIYLACDEQSAIGEFVEFVSRNSGVQVLVNSAEFNESSLRETSVTDSVVDLVMLSECQRLVGTEGSSFSDMAMTLRQAREQSFGSKFARAKPNGVVIEQGA